MSAQLIQSFLIILLLGSCGVSDRKTQTTDSVDNSNEVKYAFITEIFQYGDSVFLNADYIQFLTGHSAIKAAIREGRADTSYIDGKMHVGVPNDYYILNNNPKLRKLRIDEDCEFEFLSWLDRVDIKSVENPLSTLKNIYKDAPFILTLNKEETIIRIEEVFLP